ncbi:type IX secretion system outer membrane channel protein PorV [Emticicia sp. 21SJ11W-3]|uniref:type IX secretion system outer membrane channel protein PorV n=1 Tax=Emticicia sp. 21SJ11W-3 TaxID=2916755 RepID=UPI00209DE051|nr:type IX secretion system outer membrane channel protein PorV [Emticicia sp. 21SJ11W-3]UTA68068.1 type IX secretion system outer membrane channel protein PorV [Emticicia sp. 21SJ11W-3]
MKSKLLATLASLVLINSLSAQAQVKPLNEKRVVSTAVPFLTFSPDSRGAALGDAGVASTPDANSLFWNSAKLPFIDRDLGSTVSYTPWLRDIVDDMGLLHAAIFKKLEKNQVIGFSMTYFDQGRIDFMNQYGENTGTFDSRDMNITAGYSRKLSRDFAMGINLKYIHSNLVGSQSINQVASKPANTAAGDISFFYMNDSPTVKNREKGAAFSGGAMIQNIGSKISYGRDRYFIPTNLKLGGAMNYRVNSYNQFNFMVDVNKLLVPTPPLRDNNGNIVKGKDPNETGPIQAIFSSFTDAPDGLKEELREVTGSFGVEYLYNNMFAVRGGYFLQSALKGGERYVTTGLGLKLKNSYGIDFAYLIPVSQGNALANTWRISLIFDMQSKKNKDASDGISE